MPVIALLVIRMPGDFFLLWPLPLGWLAERIEISPVLGLVVKGGEISGVLGVNLRRVTSRDYLRLTYRRLAYRLLCVACFPLGLSP